LDPADWGAAWEVWSVDAAAWADTLAGFAGKDAVVDFSCEAGRREEASRPALSMI
jgi:hypothetical protein